MVVAGSGRAPADGSFGVSEVPAAPGMGTRFLQGGLSVGGGAIEGSQVAFCARQPQLAPQHLQKWGPGFQ